MQEHKNVYSVVKDEGTCGYTEGEIEIKGTSVATTNVGPEVRIFASDPPCAAPYWPTKFHDEIAYLNWQWRLEQKQKANKAYDRRQERHSTVPRLHRQRQRSLRQAQRTCRALERIKHARRRSQSRK
jgi:hypothetical protein